MGITIPGYKQKGDPVRHEDFNDLVAALFELDSRLPDWEGMDAPEYRVIGKITAAPPPDVLVLPSACRYSAVAMGRGWALTDVLPVYGRDIQGDQCGVYPAKVGDYCKIWRNVRVSGELPVVELEVLTEKKGRVLCPGA